MHPFFWWHGAIVGIDDGSDTTVEIRNKNTSDKAGLILVKR